LARIKDYPQLRRWLLDRDWDAILDFSDRQPRALTFLTALTYDRDPLVAWRAVEAVGLGAGRIAGRDPQRVRDHMRRLLWSLNDESGGIGWRAAETMGEILYNCLGEFKEFVPILLSLLDMEAEEDAVQFRPGVLWAIGRTAQVFPEVGHQAFPRITACLQEDDPQTRGMALWCLSKIDPHEHIAGISAFIKDDRSFHVYEQGEIHRVRVSEIARELALDWF